jgi:hypothetical protein
LCSRFDGMDHRLFHQDIGMKNCQACFRNRHSIYVEVHTRRCLAGLIKKVNHIYVLILSKPTWKYCGYDYIHSTSSLSKHLSSLIFLLHFHSKNYVSIIYFVCTWFTIIGFWAWLIFLYVCSKIFNKTNYQSCTKKAMMTNILIPREYVLRSYSSTLEYLVWK